MIVDVPSYSVQELARLCSITNQRETIFVRLKIRSHLGSATYFTAGSRSPLPYVYHGHSLRSNVTGSCCSVPLLLSLLHSRSHAQPYSAHDVGDNLNANACLSLLVPSYWFPLLVISTGPSYCSPRPGATLWPIVLFPQLTRFTGAQFISD